METEKKALAIELSFALGIFFGAIIGTVINLSISLLAGPVIVLIIVMGFSGN